MPTDFLPLRSLNNPALPNNLPQQATYFIGREKQVEEVKALLARTRLLTLVGAGGSGKTRLSLQVAADLLDGQGDGVWLVELAALSDPALVPQAAADVLGIRETAGKTVQQALVEALKAKRLLLILDNCEHLVGACAALAADLLRTCPGVHLLASSREPLNVTGEQTYRVPTLSLPDPRQPQTPQSLSQYEAVRLFIERAQAVQPSFTVTDANAPAVAQVCWRLDGIPLAIELAAARSRSLSAEEINRRLDQRFRLLTGGSRDRLPRQQTLRALIDWSYDLLTESEKSLLCRLSVLAGGWTLEAAEGVCSGGDVENFEVLDLLTSLVDKSLVVYEEGVDGQGRSRLLETVREYAGDRLQESGSFEETKDRAAAWFLGFAAEAEPQMIGPEQALWLERLEAEHDNLRASLSWYENVTEPQGEGGAAGLRLENGLRLAGSLWRFWYVRGHLSEGRQWLGRVLESPSGLESTSGLEGAAGREGAAGFEALAIRSKALSGAGNLARNQGDYAAARALYEESLTLFRQLGDQRGIAESLEGMAGVASGLNQMERAAQLWGAAASLRETIGCLRSTAEQGEADKRVSSGRTALGEATFTAAWDAGRAMTWEQAVGFALSGPGGDAEPIRHPA